MAGTSSQRAVWLRSCVGQHGPVALGAESPWTTPLMNTAMTPDSQQAQTKVHKADVKEPHVLDLWCAPDLTSLDPGHRDNVFATFAGLAQTPSEGGGVPQSVQSQHKAVTNPGLTQRIDLSPVPMTKVGDLQPKPISLEEALPMQKHDAVMHQVQSHFQAICQPWPKEAMFWNLEFLDHLPDMPIEIRQWLKQVPVWNQEQVIISHVFVDGSSFTKNRHMSEKAPAAWAFIVILECKVPDNENSYRFLCAKSHSVAPSQGQSRSTHTVGEALYDSLTTEATAMIWALAWSAQSQLKCHTCFHYDNMTVGPFSAGVAQWKCEWEYQILKRNIATLRHFLQSIGKTFSFHHLKAHVGHPWSEAVDNLAKAMAKQILWPPDPVTVVPQALQGPMSSFAWMINSDQEQIPAITAMRATFRAEGPFSKQAAPDATWHHTTEVVKKENATLRIGFASANVLTLDGGKQSQQQKGLMQLGRIANLQAQFCESNCTIIGLQECRTTGAATRHSGSHLVFQSGANHQGVRGCELWLDRVRPYAVAQKQQFRFEPTQVTITSFDDRHLLAVINAPHLQLRVLVVHAPYQGATDVELALWWQQIQAAIQRTPNTMPLVVLGDLNARLGSVHSPAVSSHQADEESETGHHVHAFLLENSLCAPSTFAEYHVGDAHTWISPHGQPCRLDFVLVPQSWKHLAMTSSIQYDIDLALARHDHFVASLEVMMTRHQAPRSSTKRCCIDVRKCADPTARANFHAYLHNPPQIPWSNGIGEHAEEIIAWVQKGAREAFAKDTQLPRQKYMSSNTWSIVQLRKQLDSMYRKSLHHQHKITKHLFLRRWFLAYRTKIQCPPESHAQNENDLQVLQRVLKQQQLWTLWHRRKLHPVARQASRQDRLDALESIAQQFCTAAISHNSSQVYRALKPLLGQSNRKQQCSFRPIPAVRLADGQLAPNQVAASERWREHFAIPERGTRATVEDLQHQLLQQDALLAPDTPFDVNTLPSLSDIEAYILRSRKNKSPGIDGLPSELYSVSAPAFAKILWPLLAKMALRCGEPLRWKGGEVCTLPKSNAISHSVDKHRSILLADYASKLAHGVMRQKLLPFFEEFRQPMQAGGVPRLGTDMLNLYVQCFARHTRASSTSSAAMFVDIRQAFYSVCRPFLAKQKIHESDLVELFIHHGWSAASFQEFLDEIHKPTALQQAHISPHMEAQVSTALHATWFQLKGQPSTLTATQAGTRPGDSVADLLFAFMMTRFVKHINTVFTAAHLHSEFQLQWIPACELSPEEVTQQTVLDASWVDDLVLLLQAPSPQALVAKAQCAIGIVYDAAVQFGLSLNMARDKTSVLLALRGPTARSTWQHILHSDPKNPKLHFQCRAHETPQHIAIVPDYVYLGSLHDHTGSPAVDLKRKLLSVQHLRKIMRKGVFRNEQVPMRTKALLFQSLIMSRLQFNIGAWQSLHMSTARTWQTQLINLYSQLSKSLTRGPGVHNLDIVAGSKQLHPMLILSTNRLRLYDRIMQTDMSPLFALLQAQSQKSEESWLDLVSHDLIRAHQYVDTSDIHDLALANQQAQLAQYSFQHPRGFSKIANRCNARYLQYLDIWVAFRKFQHAFDEASTAAGVTWSTTDTTQSSVDSFRCDTCDVGFASYKALCTHIYKKHQIVNVAHRYAPGSRCRACLKQYHSNAQLIHHLKYFHTGCLVKLVLSVDPMNDEELQDHMEEQRACTRAVRRQQRQDQHKIPAHRAAGPLRPWPWERIADLVRQDSRDCPDVATDYINDWVETVLDTLDQTQVATTLVALETMPYHGQFASQVLQAANAYYAAFQMAPTPYQGEKVLVLQEAILLWQHTAGVPAVQWLAQVRFDQAYSALLQIRIQESAAKPDITMHERRSQLQDELWDELTVPQQIHQQIVSLHHRRYQWPSPQSVPLTARPVFLYVYSGRRRDGDFKQYADMYIQQHCMEATVLLIDLAISEHHDAIDEKLVSLLLRWMHGGAIAGLLVAPPCETWTEARHVPSMNPGAPRPIRTAKHPFGTFQLTGNELTQILVSTQLLFTAIRLMLGAALCQVPGIMEHPREPKRPERATIWKLPWIRHLMQGGGVQKHLVWQAMFASASAKPTHLAVCHIPDFPRIIQRHTVQVDWTALEVLQGKRDDGSWRTASAKEYPPLFNKALANALVEAHGRRLSRSSGIAPPPEGFCSDLERLLVHVEIDNQVMQPDYARQGPQTRTQWLD